MQANLRLVLVVIAALFFLHGLGFWLLPEHAAGALGMPLLDGLGRSTQIGDFAAFFLVLGGTILYGLDRGSALYLPAAVLGLAAFGRIVAWALHGAPFATMLILAELLIAVLLVLGAKKSATW